VFHPSPLSALLLFYSVGRPGQAGGDAVFDLISGKSPADLTRSDSIVSGTRTTGVFLFAGAVFSLFHSHNM
jgi:hypothetical protein